MIYKTLGTAVCASTLLLGGCSILETVEIPEIHFDSNSYIVQPGDTLESVADRYNVDVQILGAANALDTHELIPGQKLMLVRPEQRTFGRISRPDEPVAMIPADSNDPQFTQVQDGVAVVGPVPASERVIEVHEPGAAAGVAVSDTLLDDGPLIASLPSAPGAVLPSIQKADVIESDIVVAEADRPQGTETIIQSVEGAEVGVVEIPAAVNTTVASGTAVPVPVKTVTSGALANGWNWPALGEVTRDFDLAEINRQGLDIKASPGAGVQAAADGEVVYSGRDLASYGNLVILRHKDNYLSAYSKVSDIFVKENQKVKAGDLIASVGAAADNGNELHFEIRRNGEPVDPVAYLPAL